MYESDAAAIARVKRLIPRELGANRPPRRSPLKEDAYPLHPAVIEPLPRIPGGWPVIMADPPWAYRSWVAVDDTRDSRAAEQHYRTMRWEEILALPVNEIAAEDAHLWLWITTPFLARFEEVMHAWGFTYSASGLVWLKLKRSAGKDQYQMIRLDELNAFMLHFGLGHTTRKNVELCLLGRRGNARRVAKNIAEALISPVREHSRKPDEAFDRVRRYCGEQLPRLELFSREDREGWTTWGNQVGLLNPDEDEA